MLYHGITLYAHDQDAIKAFFDYGFGHRCTDAIFSEKCVMDLATGIYFEEINQKNLRELSTLFKRISDHFGQSPCFMYTPDEEFEAEQESENRFFVARKQGQIVAYLEFGEEAETFITYLPEMKNVKGAFYLPEYRGKNIVQSLLKFAVNVLKTEGVQYIGVDYESFNSTANRFWQKYFTPYTCSVVRRIDEVILKKNEN